MNGRQSGGSIKLHRKQWVMFVFVAGVIKWTSFLRSDFLSANWDHQGRDDQLGLLGAKSSPSWKD